MMKTALIRVVNILFFLSLFWNGGCSALKAEQKSWPFHDPDTSVRESNYLDLGLRVLALELSDHSGGESSYYIEFLPRVGKIEAKCILEKAPAPTLNQKNQYLWTERFKKETEAIQFGVGNLLMGLTLAEGFDPKSHLEVRFQVRHPKSQELATVKGGEIFWLNITN